MKYNVGDKVRIKSIDWYNENKDGAGYIRYERVGTAYPVFFSKYMSNFCGEILTIKSVYNHSYHMSETSSCEYWTDEMIECKVEEETKTHNNMCKQLIDEMNPNVEVNVKTKPEPKFKVGDRIYSKYHKPSNDLEIIEVIRGDGHYGYRIKNHQTNGTYFLWEYEMCDYKLAEEGTSMDLTVKGEEVKERIEIAIPEGYEYVIESGKIIFTKKKKEYPKTYAECCRVLGVSEFEYNHTGTKMWYRHKLMATLDNLRLCRDAYWKIAGEEMGLGKPWEPDWSTDNEIKYVIEVYRNNVRKNSQGYSNTILAFPTAEMRDAFYENFKKEIEFCKELL